MDPNKLATELLDPSSTLINLFSIPQLLMKLNKLFPQSPQNVLEYVYYNIICNNFMTGSNYALDDGASIKLSTE